MFSIFSARSIASPSKWIRPHSRKRACDESTPVTCNLSGIPLRSALEIILDELQLKWTIHHDVLMITSPTKAESDEYLHTKCYDVTDLLAIPKDYDGTEPALSIHMEHIGLPGERGVDGTPGLKSPAH